MPVWNFVRKSVYRDSVTLMRLARGLESLPGVQQAAVMMGTPHNRGLLRDAGLLTPDGDAASPNDLLIAIEAEGLNTAEQARAAAEEALTTRHPPTPGLAANPPRTLDSARRTLSAANLALISVPGVYAGAEALKALRAGLHVMLFSNNVPVETEVELKRLARARGLFLMGPDCGTAIINGTPLGFANRVPRGHIGLAGASGTGLQEVSCLIASAGEGISQAIGVGGRDLSDEVGGMMMDRALAALAADAATEVVCIIGKPPGPSVYQHLQQQILRLTKPGVVYFPGLPPSEHAPWHAAATLEDAAHAAVALVHGAVPRPLTFTVPADEVARLVEETARALRQGQRFVRGIYAGGTLAYEAIGLLQARLADVAPGVAGEGEGHRVVDLGADVFTVGRPHPMLDGTLRREWIRKEGRDPSTAVLLLDVILGYGAHPDPAGEILPALDVARREAQAEGRHLAVVASVCGTDGDPQGRSAQIAALQAQGVIIMPSNAQAARLTALIAARVGEIRA
ncbi:MAG: acyl-CoA synthetase FdrA [Nitrospinae bacterium]|nr:acyl-CoA synthetase FdrA [Nitrospinota bacterium]